MGWRVALGPLAMVVVFACSDDRERSSDDDDGGVGGAGGSGASPAVTSATSGVGAGTSTTTGVGGSDACAGGPLAAPIAGCAPAPPPSTGDFHQDCVDRINQLRWVCQCLPPLDRWTEAESCSDSQSDDDLQSGQAHGNFGACGEYAQNTCPSWGSESAVIGGCLQMMWDEGPGEPFEEHGHYINMSSTTYTRVACGISLSGGWSNQNFAP